MSKIVLCIVSFMLISGCSQTPHFNDSNLNSNSLVGIYTNDDGFGNRINIVLNEDGGYESQLNGTIGIEGFSYGEWEHTTKSNSILFSPIKEHGFLKGKLKTLLIISDSNNISLIPAKKLKSHSKLMADYGQSNYSYQKNSI
ncbi:hypothetical protein BCU94_13660 [Shewanella sp. 10N.286.52.C2]|uniref:hypothetical protein n=1 Tax=unclassified Shewanella TaxID=196818 RepID=UPI000C818422|nr:MULTISPECIES: hypothetical protein [unclassified Shewanella]MDO6639251.1 hypothetical protein [Shewanella sp. 5_MG-2023]MDO6677503.1 hypothetical protein [Shewanella sp. 4_MG-2023]PMG29411.1 hypothetical protein BCU94_13660 [Shewanella sp. 10N.286.52.C2]